MGIHRDDPRAEAVVADRLAHELRRVARSDLEIELRIQKRRKAVERHAVHAFDPAVVPERLERSGHAIDWDPSERLCEFVEIRDRPLVDGLVALKHVEQLPMQRAGHSRIAAVAGSDSQDRLGDVRRPSAGGACARPRATAQTPTAQPVI
jgi:hypothetical protein